MLIPPLDTKIDPIDKGVIKASPKDCNLNDPSANDTATAIGALTDTLNNLIAQLTAKGII